MRFFTTTMHVPPPAPPTPPRLRIYYLHVLFLFLYDPLRPFSRRKRALESDEVLALYHDNDIALKAVFERYGKVDERSGIGGGGSGGLLSAQGALLNISEFGLLLRDACLLGGNTKVQWRTVDNGGRAWGGVTHDNARILLLCPYW